MITDLPELTVTRLCGYLLPVIPFIAELYKGYHRTIKKAKIKAIGVIECSL